MHHNNYYRVTGYLCRFKASNSEYYHGIRLSQLESILQLDTKLRNYVLQYVEIFEISLARAIAYEMAQYIKTPFPHIDTSCFKCGVIPDFLQEKCTEVVEKRKNDEIKWKNNIKKNVQFPITHFQEKYDTTYNTVPIWMLVELLDFGSLCSFYKSLCETIREKIILSYTNPKMQKDDRISTKIFESWITSIRELRNRCAHNERIYDYVGRDLPKRTHISTMQYNKNASHLYRTWKCLQWFIDAITPENTMQEEIVSLIENSNVMENKEYRNFFQYWY